MLLSPEERRAREHRRRSLDTLQRIHDLLVSQHAHQAQDAIPEHHTAEHDAYNPSPASIRVINETSDADKESDKANQQENCKLQKRGLWIQGLLCLFTAGAFAAAAVYAGIARDQKEIMTDTLAKVGEQAHAMEETLVQIIAQTTALRDANKINMAGVKGALTRSTYVGGDTINAQLGDEYSTVHGESLANTGKLDVTVTGVKCSAVAEIIQDGTRKFINMESAVQFNKEPMRPSAGMSPCVIRPLRYFEGDVKRLAETLVTIRIDYSVFYYPGIGDAEIKDGCANSLPEPITTNPTSISFNPYPCSYDQGVKNRRIKLGFRPETHPKTQ